MFPDLGYCDCSVICRMTDLEKGTNLVPGSWTFEESPIQWQPIECCVQLDSVYPLPTGGRTLALKNQLEVCLKLKPMTSNQEKKNPPFFRLLPIQKATKLKVPCANWEKNYKMMMML